MRRMGEIKIWGIIHDEEGCAIPHVCVRLLRKIYHNRRTVYEDIEECYSDEEGRYAFLVPRERERVYKVVVIWNL